MNYKILIFVLWMYIISFYCTPAFCKDVSGANTKIDSSSVVLVRDNFLTVKVKGMSLKKVLEEITKQIPIKLVFFVSEEDLIMADFTGLPVEKGLKQLLRNYNYTIVKGTEKLKDGGHEITKIIILSKTGGNRNSKAEPMIVASEEPIDEDLEVLNDEDMQDTFEEEAERVATPGEAPSIESLRQDLLDEDPIKREEAVSSLGESGDKTGVYLITEVLRSDKDEGVRMSAADALGSIGGEESIDALKSALRDEDALVRESAIHAISLIGGDRAIEALNSALSSGMDEDMEELIKEELEVLKE